MAVSVLHRPVESAPQSGPSETHGEQDSRWRRQNLYRSDYGFLRLHCHDAFGVGVVVDRQRPDHLHSSCATRLSKCPRDSTRGSSRDGASCRRSDRGRRSSSRRFSQRTTGTPVGGRRHPWSIDRCFLPRMDPVRLAAKTCHCAAAHDLPESGLGGVRSGRIQRPYARSQISRCKLDHHT
jgi:hypothetical protein